LNSAIVFVTPGNAITANQTPLSHTCMFASLIFFLLQETKVWLTQKIS